MPYKQQPKSPLMKALVGDQHKLPKVLKDAIIASPAKQTKSTIRKGTVNAAREMLKDSTSINNPNLTDAEVIKAAKVKGFYNEASSRAKRAAAEGDDKYSFSPLKKKDACYNKVKARYDVFPSAYASGAIAKCRKVGAANWGNKSKK